MNGACSSCRCILQLSPDCEQMDGTQAFSFSLAELVVVVAVVVSGGAGVGLGRPQHVNVKRRAGNESRARPPPIHSHKTHKQLNGVEFASCKLRT